MISPARACRAAVAVVSSVALVGAAAARAEGPTIGGSVPSVLALSVGEPSAFARSAAGHGGRVYTALIGVEVTATEEPTRLSIADGEAFAGLRRGHLVRGSLVLAPALRAASAGHGAYRSLDASVDPVLEQWNEPLANAPATIRLRQTVRGAHPRTLGGYHKLLLVTATAAGP